MSVHQPFPQEPMPGASGAGRYEDQIFIPKPILFMMIALALFTVIAVGMARASQRGVTREDPVAPGKRISFTVAMAGPEGAIDVTRADGRTIRLAGAHQDIFPRLILQGFQNIRMRDGVALDRPMAIIVSPDGQRLLEDQATRHTVRLAAFGPDNGASFDAILTGVQAAGVTA